MKFNEGPLSLAIVFLNILNPVTNYQDPTCKNLQFFSHNCSHEKSFLYDSVLHCEFTKLENSTLSFPSHITWKSYASYIIPICAKQAYFFFPFSEGKSISCNSAVNFSHFLDCNF